MQQRIFIAHHHRLSKKQSKSLENPQFDSTICFLSLSLSLSLPLSPQPNLILLRCHPQILPYPLLPSTNTHSMHHPSHSHPTATTTTLHSHTSTPVLRLRATAGPTPPQNNNRPRIQWAEDVIDNEGLGRKRSKVCCIYHAPHPVGESSSESSSSSSSSSDSDSCSDTAGGGLNADDGRARIAGKRKWRQQRGHQHGEAAEGCEHDHGDAGGGGMRRENGKARVKRKSKNAYETVPKVKTEEVKS